MGLMSRRSALGALAAPLVAPRVGVGGPLAGAQPVPGGQSAGGSAVVHRAPRSLASDAVTHDWTSFLGPTHNGVSTETRLSRTLPPPLVWELPTGSGYASPAIAGDRLVYLHRVGDEEIVECLHPETGATHWRLRYPSAYRDRYGYNNGPRSSPVIDGAGERAYTVGPRGGSTRWSWTPAAWSGGPICALHTACGRIFSAPARLRSSTAVC